MHTTLRERAVAMRREKKSYREITDALGVSKGTLSGWFNGYPWSEEIRRDLEAATQPAHRARIAAMGRARSVKFSALRAEARREAREKFSKLVSNPLFVAGIALYWGEGSKSFASGQLRLGNVDPRLLRVFVRFLMRCCGVERSRLRAWVLAYPDLDTGSCVRHWSRTLGIPAQQFHKTQVIQGRAKLRRVTRGVCTVVVMSRLLCEQMDEWTNCLSERLQRGDA